MAPEFRTILLPDLLDRLARAGRSGMTLDSTLREEASRCMDLGYPVAIDSARAFLRDDADALIPYWIERETAGIWGSGLPVSGFLRTGSTNDEAIRLVREGMTEGLVFAEEQTAGKGRLGRAWVSHARVGLYFSLVTPLNQPAPRWQILTFGAAVALARCVRDVVGSGLRAENSRLTIKWPNDLLLDGRKCAGILLETASGRDGARSAIVGVGINTGPLPVEVRDMAATLASICDPPPPRRRLLAEYVRRFRELWEVFDAGRHQEILQAWKDDSTMWQGTPVWVVEGDGRYAATTCDITDTGALRVVTSDGELRTLLAADVSIRGFEPTE